MDKSLTLGSLFDGSGGFPLGGILTGITPLWASEIEPFPIRVTTKRLPFMKHYGDVSSLSGADLEPADIITFGSPCQDMSVAGKRQGLGAERSGLFYEAIRVIKEMREKTDGKYPRYIVWENVQGAFSSNRGEDFRQVIREIIGIKGCEASAPRPSKWAGAGCVMADDFSVAWRLLDAQYWGVPQRRKRIYLVADLAGQSAGKILFESEGLSGYSAESFRAWQRAAGSIEKGSGETGALCLNDQGGNRMDVTEDMTATLRAAANHPPLVFENHAKDSRYRGPLDKSQTVLATFGSGGNNQPLVMQCFGICSEGGRAALSDDPGSRIKPAVKTPVSYRIDRAAFNQGKNAGYDFSVEEEKEAPIVARGPGAVAQPKTLKIRSGKEGGGKGPLIQEGMSATLSCNNDQTLFEPAWSSNKASYFTCASREKAGALVATDCKDPPIVGERDEEYIVRRLTPTECARLQGFPDWWCSGLGTEDPSGDEIEMWSEVFEEHRKTVTKASHPKSRKQIVKWLMDPRNDSAEYRMWGNGVALPNVCFVLAGIAYYCDK